VNYEEGFIIYEGLYDSKYKRFTMIPKTAFIIIIAVMSIAFLSVPVLAAEPTWTASNDSWTATVGTNSLVMWNTTGNHTWSAPNGVSSVWYLVIGGGGGGSSSGGGAGALWNGTLNATGLTNYNITIGTGGSGSTETSSIYGVAGNSSGFSTITADGGGKGAYNDKKGEDGGSGSGGGASTTTAYTWGNATNTSHGNHGGWSVAGSPYPAGAGGGAGAVGQNATAAHGGAGGNGLQINITGNLTWYAGGGGGTVNTAADNSAAIGGYGGGGAGGNTSGNGKNATNGLGGGGGGSPGGGGTSIGGKGGSGLVIIQYATPTTPEASFTVNSTGGILPVTVHFTDTSTNTPTGWNWSYRDISGSNTTVYFSTTQHPNFTFSWVGNFSIALNATNSIGTGSSSQGTFVNTSNIISSFTANSTGGQNSVNVLFTDTTNFSATSWNWTYRNVTGSNITRSFSTAQNPVYTFTKGNFSIQLTASKPNSTNISTQVTFVNVSDTLPPNNINVTAPPTTTCSAITWTWANPSDLDYAGSLVWWNGTLETNITSSDTTRTWTNLSQNVSYTWGVQAFDNNVPPNFNASIVNRSRTTPWCTFAVDFSATPLTGNYTLPVAFTGTYSASPPASWEWSWGDGTPNTTTSSLNVSHSYTYSGSFSPTVTAVNASGTSYTVTKPNYINIYAPVVNTTHNRDDQQAKLVQFNVHTLWGMALPNSVVTIQGINTTAGTWDWITTMLGIPLGEAPIQNTLMQGTTDSMGNIEFMMVPTTKYNVTTTLAGYTFPSLYIAPHDERYEIVANPIGGGDGWIEPTVVNQSYKNLTVIAWRVSATDQGINVTYYDNTSTTTGGFVNITQDGTVLKLYTITNNSFAFSQNVTVPVGGTSLKINATIMSTSGNIMKSYVVGFNGPPVTTGGFPATIVMYGCIGIILIMGLMAGATTSPQVSVITCATAWIFLAIGWLEPLTTSVGIGKVVGLFTVATLLAVLWNMRMGKRMETGR
jgi:PKD repeat protein